MTIDFTKQDTWYFPGCFGRRYVEKRSSFNNNIRREHQYIKNGGDTETIFIIIISDVNKIWKHVDSVLDRILKASL